MTASSIPTAYVYKNVTTPTTAVTEEALPQEPTSRGYYLRTHFALLLLVGISIFSDVIELFVGIKDDGDKKFLGFIPNTEDTVKTVISLYCLQAIKLTAQGLYESYPQVKKLITLTRPAGAAEIKNKNIRYLAGVLSGLFYLYACFAESVCAYFYVKDELDQGMPAGIAMAFFAGLIYSMTEAVELVKGMFELLQKTERISCKKKSEHLEPLTDVVASSSEEMKPVTLTEQSAPREEKSKQCCTLSCTLGFIIKFANSLGEFLFAYSAIIEALEIESRSAKWFFFIASTILGFSDFLFYGKFTSQAIERVQAAASGFFYDSTWSKGDKAISLLAFVMVGSLVSILVNIQYELLFTQLLYDTSLPFELSMGIADDIMVYLISIGSAITLGINYMSGFYDPAHALLSGSALATAYQSACRFFAPAPKKEQQEYQAVELNSSLFTVPNTPRAS